MRCLIVFVMIIFPVLPANAENIIFVSPNTQTNLIELYTSEGCSSCPPADRWLSNLKKSTGLWNEFVPLAFHVDYWDYIGWKDRFASPAYGVRQRQYAERRGVSSVYTPAMVLNGREWRGWYRYKQPRNSSGQNVGQLRLALNQRIVDSQFRFANPAINTSGRELSLHIALLGFDLVTEVKAGENENRSLQHDFVVLAYKVAAFQRQQNLYQIKTELPLTHVNSKIRAITAWVSPRKHPKPIQAVGGWLP